MIKQLLFLLLLNMVFLGLVKPKPAKPLRKGNDYALFFATNDYAKMPRLNNPISDAENIAQVLHDQYGFDTLVVRNPTLEVIQVKIDEYRQNFASGRWKSQSQLLIYFTGHGSVDDETGYYLPTDVQPSKLITTAFAYPSWRKKISKLKCQHILTVVDACYSGTFDPNYGTKDGNPLFGFRGSELTESEKLLSENEQYKARIFFTSTAEDKTTPDQSTFAQNFLEGLRGRNNDDGILTSDELWLNYLKKSRPNPRGGTFEDNQADANFLFITEKKAEVTGNLSDLQKEVDTWQRAKTRNTMLVYEEYLRGYPDGDFVNQANQAIAILIKQEEVEAWSKAKKQNSKESYTIFLVKYPSGIYAETAKNQIKFINQNLTLVEVGTAKIDYSAKKSMIESRLSFEPTMVFVKGGNFSMGGTIESDEKPIHEVNISDFYIGKYEITQKQWLAVTGTNPSYFKCEDCPVENVSWIAAQDFIQKLNDKTGKKYTLPSEAEWEYAARAGTGKENYTYSGSNDIKFVGWYDTNANKQIQKTGQKQPNKLGLYDMSGNVWEWCSDLYNDEYYKNSPVSNPMGANEGMYRVLRGGSWFDNGKICTITYRFWLLPETRRNSVGLRVLIRL